MRSVLITGILAGIMIDGCQRVSEDVARTIEEAKKNEIKIILPSPAQIANAYRKAGLKYISGVTLPLDKPAPASPVQKKIYYGMLAADFAYCAFTKQLDMGKSYYAKIIELTRELEPELEQEFKSYAQSYENNYDKLDSIIILFAKIQEKLDENIELMRKYQNKIAYFIGGWIESMYLGANASPPSNPEITSLIKEQFIIMERVIENIEKNEFENKQELMPYISKIKDVVNTFNNLPELKNLPDTVSIQSITISDESREKLKQQIISLRQSLI